MLRFAQNLNDDMNISDLRIALFNHIISKQKNENLIARMQDTYNNGDIQKKDKEILDILNLFTIDYTNVLLQSENIKYHQQIAMKFLIDKKAFNCFCSDQSLENDALELEKNNKPYEYSGFCENLSDEATINCEAPFTVRLRKPQENINFLDTVQGDFEYSPTQIDSFIILNKDKTPTYNFACAIDDMISDISTVVRDEMHLLDTAKQIHIRTQIGYDKNIQYVHLPAVISKEDEDTSVQYLIDQGYLPVAIANYLVSLGYPTQDEIFTIEEAIQWFDISKVSKTAMTFDFDKLNLINAHYIKTMDDMRLSKLIGYADTDIGKLAKIYLDESSTINGLKERISSIFANKNNFQDFEKEYKSITVCLKEAPFIKEYSVFKKYINKHTNIEDKNLDAPLRYILTGAQNGPNLNEIYPLIRNYLGEIIK